MAIEIERKFLIDHTKLPKSFDFKMIRQGYLSKNPTVRIRTIGEIGTEKAYITVKSKGKISKQEYEYEIPLNDALNMMYLTKNSIYKIRHYHKVGEHTWEVDQFTSPHLSGFWLAEIELESEDEKFVMPDWVVKEVTEDSRYSNANLAKHGIPK